MWPARIPKTSTHTVVPLLASTNRQEHADGSRGAQLRLTSAYLGLLSLERKMLGKRTKAAAPAWLRTSCRRCPVCGSPPWSVITHRIAPESARTVPPEGALRRRAASPRTPRLQCSGVMRRGSAGAPAATALPRMRSQQVGGAALGLWAHDRCSCQLWVRRITDILSIDSGGQCTAIRQAHLDWVQGVGSVHHGCVPQSSVCSRHLHHNF